jgi:hypothetical protein
LLSQVLVNVMIAVLLDKFVTDGEEGSIEEAQLDAIITKLRQDKTRATNATVDALPPEVRSAAARCDITLVVVCAPGDRGAKGIGRTQERTRLRRTSRPR